MRYLVTAGNHVSNIRAIARQPPIAIRAKLLEGVFSVGSAPKLYNKDLNPADLS
jgi:hypothetical protein